MASKRHFVALDGLRGLAALSVTARHFGQAFPRFATTNEAQLAVDFFFMLSGFVIGYAYEAKLKAGLSARRFAAIRLVRLYPMVFIGVVLGIASWFLDGVAGHSAVLGAAVFALLMLPAPRFSAKPVSAFPLNGPLWSLSFELLSNFVYVAVLPVLTTKRLAVLAGLFAVGLGMIAIFHGPLDMGMAWAPSSFLGLIRVFCPFTIGLLIFRIGGSRRSNSELLSLFAGILLVAALWMPVRNEALYDFIAVMIVFPIVLLLGMSGPDQGPLRKGWAWLGAVSYPVYAINQPFFRGVGYFANGSSSLVWGILSFVGCVLLADLLRRFYDEPVRSWLSRTLLHRSIGEQAPAADSPISEPSGRGAIS